MALHASITCACMCSHTHTHTYTDIQDSCSITTLTASFLCVQMLYITRRHYNTEMQTSHMQVRRSKDVLKLQEL